jgi:phage/plasmid-like protein (TIGR03299 family)
MAHELTIRADGFAEIAFVGQTPWHGLGQELEQDADMATWRKQAGLDWQIERAPVQYTNGSLHTFGGQEVLYRSDTNAPLSIVSNRYKEVQPEQVLEFFRGLVESQGFKLHTAGSLKGGKRIWALAETGKVADIVRDDPVGGYLLLATSCDKGMATQARFTSVRVVCANTLAMAERGGSNIVSVSHSTTFVPESVKRQLGLAAEQFDSFVEMGKHLSRIKLNTEKTKDVLAKLLAPINQAAQRSGVFELEKVRSFQKIMELFEGGGMGADMAGVKGTAWGLVNAVTEYVDHHSPSRTADARLNSAWFGRGDSMKSSVVDLLLAA